MSLRNTRRFIPLLPRKRKKKGLRRSPLCLPISPTLSEPTGNGSVDFLSSLKEKKLFLNSEKTAWLCLNCGHIHRAEEAPYSMSRLQTQQRVFYSLGTGAFYRRLRRKIKDAAQRRHLLFYHIGRFGIFTGENGRPALRRGKGRVGSSQGKNTGKKQILPLRASLIHRE